MVREVLLTKDVEYSKDGVLILVPKGTQILLDEIQQIGLINGDHVEI